MNSTHLHKRQTLKAVSVLAATFGLGLSACSGVDAEPDATFASENTILTFQEPEQLEPHDKTNVVSLPDERIQLDDAVNGVAFLDGETGLAAALNREVLLLDVETGTERWRTSPCPSCSTVHLTRSEDGTEIVMPSRGRDGGAVYDPQSGNKVRDLSGPDYRVAQSPDASETLSVLSLEAILEVPQEDPPVWHSNVKRIGAVGYSPKGDSFVISADGDGSPRKGGKVLVYDSETREPDTRIDYAQGSFNHLAYSPDGDRLILASYKDRVLVWDMKARAPHCRFNSDDQGRGLRAFKLSPDGALIATGGGTDNWGYVRLWDTQTCQLQAETTFSKRVGSLSFHPNQPKLAAGAWNGKVAVIDFSDLQP